MLNRQVECMFSMQWNIVQTVNIMNPVRILTISNRYLLCVGFAVNKFSKKFKIQQRSILGTIVFVLLNVLYLLCLHEHYDKKALLENLKDLSKTIYYSMYAHLFVGIASICVILLESKAYLKFSNQVIGALPKHAEVRPNFDRMELFVYHRTFVNLLVFIGILAYDLTVIDLKSLTRSKAMLFLGKTILNWKLVCNFLRSLWVTVR